LTEGRRCPVTFINAKVQNTLNFMFEHEVAYASGEIIFPLTNARERKVQ
jgi:hypothetical protein